MKAILPLLIMMGICGSYVTSVYGQSDEAIIQDIRDKYAEITTALQQQQLAVHYIYYHCPDYPELGHIAFYSDAETSELRLVEQDFIAGDHFGRTDRYYMWDKELFFIYSSHSTWHFDMDTGGNGAVEETVDNYIEERFYLHNGEPVRCLEKDYEVRSAESDNPTSETTPNYESDCSELPMLLDMFDALLPFQHQTNNNNSCIWEE